MYEVEKIYCKVFARHPHQAYAWKQHGAIDDNMAAEISHTVYGVHPVIWYLMENRTLDFHREKREEILAYLGTLPSDMTRYKKYKTAKERFDRPKPAREAGDSDNNAASFEEGTVATEPYSDSGGESDQEQDVQKGL
jgi:hypothetical protein